MCPAEARTVGTAAMAEMKSIDGGGDQRQEAAGDKVDDPET